MLSKSQCKLGYQELHSSHSYLYLGLLMETKQQRHVICEKFLCSSQFQCRTVYIHNGHTKGFADIPYWWRCYHSCFNCLIFLTALKMPCLSRKQHKSEYRNLNICGNTFKIHIENLCHYLHLSPVHSFIRESPGGKLLIQSNTAL